MKDSKKDPHAERERSRYDSPISSRELIMEHLEARGEPLVMEQIAHDLDHQSDAQFEALRRRLRAMERDGQIIRNRRGGLGLTRSMDLTRGRVQGHKDGFGFLVPEEGGEDMFLSAREMRKVMHGDRAMARVSGVDRRGRTEGAIVEVLEHACHRVAGRVYAAEGVSVVVPNQTRISHEILVKPDDLGGATHGQMVVAEITTFPDAHQQPIGIVAQVLGDHMAPGMEIEVALHSFDLPHTWPEEVDAEAAQVPARVPPKAKANRVDLRKLPLVTIDGEDSRDFDDAVFCEKEGKGWRLLVAIADVSAYVKPGSGLDTEALNRGTSVYFPEEVIPMLPEVLSNGLCSINPRVDRLCMVCELHFGARGKVTDFRFFEGVMRSTARLTYTQVGAALGGDKAERKRLARVMPQLETLHSLYKMLAKRRAQRGAISFDTPETRIIFGPDRKIESIVPTERNDAHKLIEECMIAANVAAGEFLAKHKMPGLYRVHEGPSGDKLASLRDFLAAVGLDLGGGDEPRPRDYAALLDSAQERPDVNLIQTIMLRSLKQAIYTPHNKGHFGLAVDHYAHFTSPIRRYPDLLLHRALKHIIAGGKAADFEYSMSNMEQLGEHCSMTGRRADEAGWDVMAWLKAEYMLDKVGQQFPGIVTSVTGFGVFVQLQEVFVEGLVHVSALNNDYYHFDATHHRLTGERTGHSYQLGDSIEVIVNRVDLEERRIDFALPPSAAEDERTDRGPAKKRSRKGGARKPPVEQAEPNEQTEVASEEPVEQASEPVVEAVAEPVVEQAADQAAEPAPEPAAKKPARKTTKRATSKSAKKPTKKSAKAASSEDTAVADSVELAADADSATGAATDSGADSTLAPAKKARKPRTRKAKPKAAAVASDSEAASEPSAEADAAPEAEKPKPKPRKRRKPAAKKPASKSADSAE